MTDDAPIRTRLFRGRACPILKSTRNVATGVEYDHVLYQRQVTNRRDNSVSSVTLTRKIRRAGTGVPFGGKEIEIEVGEGVV